MRNAETSERQREEGNLIQLRRKPEGVLEREHRGGDAGDQRYESQNLKRNQQAGEGEEQQRRNEKEGRYA